MADPFSDLVSDLAPPARDLSQQATPEALRQGAAEQAEVPFQPIDSATFKRTPTKFENPVLDKEDLSQSFIDDVRLAMIRSSDRDINPHSLGRTPREVLTNAVAQQALGFSFEPSEDMGAMSGYWTRFKEEMKPSFFGAMARGAKEAVGSTIGGIAGAAAGSPGGPLGSIAAGFALAKAGAEAQEMLFPPTPEDIAQAMADFQLPPTRYGRMLGQYLPALLTAKPVNPAALTKPEVVKSLVAATIPSAMNIAWEGSKGMLEGKELGEVAEELLDPQRTLEQLAFDAAFALATKPNSAGRWLMDKKYRTEQAARRRANDALVQAAGGEGAAIAAAERIAYNAPKLAVDGVQIGSGDLSQNVGLVGLQGAVERRNNEMLGRRMQSLRQVGMNLGEALPESPKSPDYLRYQFEGQNEAAIQQLAATRDRMISEGYDAAAERLNQALAQIDIEKQLVSQNRRTMEQAYARTTAALQTATEELMQNLGMTTKEQANLAIANRFQTNMEILQADIAKDYQDAAAQGSTATFKNAVAAAQKATLERSAAAQSKKLDVVPRIEGIIEAYSPDPKTGQIKVWPVSEVQKILSEVTADLREKQSLSNNQRRLLKDVKDGLLQDLDAAGQISESVRKANARWRDFSDRFQNETSSGILREDPATMIDRYMETKGVREVRRLRSALVEPGTNDLPAPVADNLATYMLNMLANKGTTTSKQLTTWMASNEGTRFLEAFPETAPRIRSVIDGIAKASADVEAAFAADKAADQQHALSVAQIKRDETAKQNLFSQQTKMTERLADEKYFREIKRIESEAAQQFLGASPLVAFGEVIGSRDPVNGVTNLVNRAFQDPTGGATEALKGVARQWINEAIRNAGKALIDNLDPAKKVDVNELRVSNAKLTTLLTKGPTMDALSAILSPKELQALNLAQRQLVIMEQRIGLSAGESATQLNRMADMTLEQGLSDNLLSGVFRILRSADPTYKRQNADTMSRFVDVVNKAWKGDVPTLAKAFLEDAIANPEVAIEALRNPKNNPTRSEMFLKNWLMWHNRNSPYQPLAFSVQNTSKEDLSEGAIYKDTRYGYAIYRTPQKKFRLVDPMGRVSIHETFSDAEAKANNKLIRQNATP